MRTDKLKKLQACPEAVEWASKQRSRAQAWQDCNRGDWMLWLIGKTSAGDPGSVERRKLVLCCCDCAELAMEVMPEESRGALRDLRIWAETGKGYLYGIRSRAEAAADAAYAAYAAHAAAEAAADAAWDKNPWVWCADAGRKHYPKPPRIK